MKIIFIVLTVFTANLFAAENPPLKNPAKQPLLAQKIIDISEQFEFNFNRQKYQLIEEIQIQTQQGYSDEVQKKSGIKAALFSAIVPGAGEFYAESYWKGALFAVIEIAAWSGYFSYRNKGDSKDREMKRFGDESWSERHYWSRVYELGIESGSWSGGQLNPDSDGLLTANEVDANIELFRALESNNNFPFFSHTLPRTKTQQYYEMIYKYPSQFGAGWNELGGSDTWAYYDGGANLKNLTPDVSKYRNLRNTSNDFYASATNMATVVLINHLASAIDAAFTTKNYNAHLSYSIYAGQKQYASERVNMYGLTLSW